MKVLCFSIPLLLYIVEFICSHHLNVGTVLFTKADLCRKCWSESERTLLIARQVMQGVLPDPEFMDITKPGTITVLLEYFQSCFEVIGQSTCGKTQHLMFLALSDALGGYLRSYILPITRQAYYAGQIKYLEARRVFQFYGEIKDFLKTNGAGWARPHRVSLSCKIRPLKITTRGCDTACSQLFFREEAKANICSSDNPEPVTVQPTPELTSPSTACPMNGVNVKKKFIDIVETLKNSKYAEVSPYGEDGSQKFPAIDLSGRNVQKIENIRKNARQLKDRLLWSKLNSSFWNLGFNEVSVSPNSSTNEVTWLPKTLKKRFSCEKKTCKQTQSCASKELVIPLPVLDDPERPHAIGLPFRVRPLRSLRSPNAVCILVRYYTTVIKCLVTRSNHRCDLFNFNGQFHAWLNSYIFPRLTDEEWYPAFGGVLRIAETIKEIGCKEKSKCHSESENDIGFMFSKEFVIDESDYCKHKECKQESTVTCHRSHERMYLTLAILAIVLLWIMALCYCICCHCSGIKEDCEVTDICEEPKKKAVDPNNSFLVQCLIKFFKRADAEDKKCSELCGTNCDDMRNDSEVELANRSLGGPPDNRRKGYCDPSKKSSSREDKCRPRQGKEAIVLPAHISPLDNELPLGLTSFWPFSDLLDEMDVVKHYQSECLKSPFCQKERPMKIPRRDMEQFEMIWKRDRSGARTSESCAGMEIEKMMYADEEMMLRGRVRGRRRTVLEGKSGARCNYSDSAGSEGDNRKRIIYVRRSRSAFDYPASYPYSCNSSPHSYSSSQMEDDTPMELYDHVAACHNSFARRHHHVDRQFKSESESERGLTSSSTSLTPVKRTP